MVNPILLIAIPLALAFAIPLFGLISKKIIRYIPVAAFLFNLIISISLIPKVLQQSIVVKISGFQPPFGINLFVGPVGILFSTLIALTGFLVSIYALDYIEKKGSTEKYHILFLILLTGATGVALTGDIFNLFVFFEILCISSYALVAYLGNKAGIESSIKYLIQGSIGSSLLLLGIGLIYGQFGTLNMADIANQINSSSSPALFVPMVLMVTGLGVEAAIFPLNAWLPDAHSSAPSSISAILSGIAIEVGLYAVIRILLTLFNAADFMMFVLFLGLLTLLIGEMSAFKQNNLKRMLAYSSIGQIGLILFAISLKTHFGISAGLFQVVSHTLGKALLFLAAGYMIYKTGSMQISSLNGIGKKMPITSLLFTIGSLSIIGLPPFVGFASKLMVIRASLASGDMLFTILVGIILLGTVIEGTYFFRVVQSIYFKESNESVSRSETPVVGLIPMFIFALLIIFIGIYPDCISKILNAASSEFLNRLDYVRSILG